MDIFTNWKAVLEAVVTAVLVAVLMYLANLSSLEAFSLHTVEFIALVAFAGSLLKNIGTNRSGNFVGLIKIK